MLKGAKGAAERLGLNVVLYRSFPPGTTNFSPILVELKVKAPDALIVGAHLATAQIFSKQLADAWVYVKLVSINTVTIPDYYGALGVLAEGIIAPSEWEPGVKYKHDFGPSREEFYIA
ncbi:MAG: ABC transporter substrate-binding protein [Thermosphaera sp.]